MTEDIKLATKVAEKAVEREGQLKDEKSFAMMLLEDAKANSKRWFTISMVILFMWLFTIGGFVWYLNQYDFISQDGSGYNNVITGESGDINNGANSESKEKR